MWCWLFEWFLKRTSIKWNSRSKNVIWIILSKYRHYNNAYHTDNEIFMGNLFLNHVQKKWNWFLSVELVNIIKTEEEIRDIRDSARKILLHFMCRWSKVISINKWPYASRHESNAVSDKLDGQFSYLWLSSIWIT